MGENAEREVAMCGEPSVASKDVQIEHALNISKRDCTWPIQNIRGTRYLVERIQKLLEMESSSPRKQPENVIVIRRSNNEKPRLFVVSDVPAMLELISILVSKADCESTGSLSLRQG